MPQKHESGSELDLLALSLEITIYGVLLAFILPFTLHRLDAAGVATICCFLAAVLVVKLLILPPRFMFSNLWGRALAMTGCAFFSWWLIYQAENTRVGWYRFHILQRRVQQMISKAPAYVITSDSDDIITGCSDNIETLTGYRKDELIGQPTRILTRSTHAEAHEQAAARVVKVLRDNDHTPDAGWAVQGATIQYVRRKDGSLTPVRIYAGGIRWSEDMQFPGDIDLFAIFVPESLMSAVIQGDAPEANSGRVRAVPGPPPSPSLSPRGYRSDDELDPLMARPGSKGELVPRKE